MQYQLKRIQDGSFAKEFMDDQAAGAPKFKKLQEEYSHPHLETVGPKLRAGGIYGVQISPVLRGSFPSNRNQSYRERRRSPAGVHNVS